MTLKKSRRSFLKTAGGVGASLAISSRASGKATRSTSTDNMAAFSAPPLEVVRIGMIGTGSRGSGHVRRLLRLEGVEIKAICDSYEPAAARSQEFCVQAGKPKPDGYSRGELDYNRMLERDDLDAVVISTPWKWHAPQAVAAMKAGKHVFTEVPAMLTVDEGWQLVETAEATQRHCMMMENVCYGREELLALHMCRLGLLGELLHGEGAYIHDLRSQMKHLERRIGTWRTGHHERRNGNLYPTHGLGPIAQYMNINRGDRFDYLVSMSSPARGRGLYAKENFPADHLRNQAEYICGDMNTSLIKTFLGKTIVVQHDTTSPRPYDRINLIQGTKGILRGYPGRVVIEGRDNTHEWTEIEDYYQEFEHPLWKRMGELAAKAGGHGGMDFLMMWRMIYCLRNGEPLDQDVYDAASWSVVSPLSEKSVANRSLPVDFPDYTRGKWKAMKPLGVIA